jgi:hypothetical protein
LSSELEAPYLAPDHPDAGPDPKREADLKKAQGLNRASWDLTYEGATRVPGSTNDAGDVSVGPVVPSGTYTLRLSAGGETISQPLIVVPDPRSTAALENIKTQIDFLLDVRDRITAIATDAVRIRAIRTQLNLHNEQLAEDPRTARLAELGEAASDDLRSVELALYNPDAKVNYDILAGRQGGAQLYSRLGWLYRSSMSHDGPPTQGMQEVNAELTRLYEQSKAELERILEKDVGQLNSLAAELGVDYIIQ